MSALGASKSTLKRILSWAAPRTLATVQSIRARRHAASLQQKWGLEELAQQFIAEHGLTVSGGPFAGLKLIYSRNYAGAISLLVGSHECELADTWNKILNSDYQTILNVGCAEGFYAVGCALKMPHVRVIAHDIDPWARRFCRRLARNNGVGDRVEVRGWCSPATMTHELTDRSLLFCDCEGYESVLLDPVKCPRLRECDMLIEVHEFAKPGLHAELRARFAESHTMQTFEIQQRIPRNYPALRVLPEGDRHRAIVEARALPSCWAMFRKLVPRV